jgi:hypothetical protein
MADILSRVGIRRRPIQRLLAKIETLRGLGYRRFKAVQQEFILGTTRTLRHCDDESFAYTFPMDTSGPFGDEAAGKWLDHDDIVETYRSIFRATACSANKPSFRCDRCSVVGRKAYPHGLARLVRHACQL